MSAAPEPPDWLEEIEHTADAGFRVRASDLPELFERAAAGLFSVICDLRRVRPDRPTEIRVEASDLAALMVRWLSELNYRHISERQLFARFKVEQLSESELAGLVHGEGIDPARHEIFTEVKAVTFHGLKIERTAGLWLAEVILDL